jgi:hypothetical protein
MVGGEWLGPGRPSPTRPGLRAAAGQTGWRYVRAAPALAASADPPHAPTSAKQPPKQRNRDRARSRPVLTKTEVQDRSPARERLQSYSGADKAAALLLHEGGGSM